MKPTPADWSAPGKVIAMAKLLGKIITASGGVLVAAFSLVGLIVVAASDSTFVTAGFKAHAIIQGIILVILGGAGLVGGALMCYDKAAKALAGLAVAIAILASSLAGAQLAQGGMNFYIILGAMISIVGGCWDCCCKDECPPAGEKK